MLEIFDLFIDGTLHSIKNCDGHSQVYIISILYQKGTKTFSYPILSSLMKRKNTQIYIELFIVRKLGFKCFRMEQLKLYHAESSERQI